LFDARLRAQSIYRSLTSAAAHARLLASRPKSIDESNCMNHTDPSFNGVVVALVIIIVIGGMIEVIAFFIR
jgi:uncharacterized protein YciW